MARNVSNGGLCAIITGGNRGIGRAIATRLALNNNIDNIAIVCRSEQSASNAASEILRDSCSERTRSLAIFGFSCDVGNPNQVAQAFRDIETKFMGAVPTLIVNAAGVTNDSLIVRASETAINETISTNLLGPIWVCRAAIKKMLKTRGSVGSILNVGSVVGSYGNAGQSIYSASKAGLQGLTASLAAEVGSRNIRINTLELGYVNTDMTKQLDESNIAKKYISMGRFACTKEIARAAEFILMEATYMNGSTVKMDGGLKFILGL